jgi:hypothetical protein
MKDAMERFIIVRHSSGEGYVVRTGYIHSDGTIWIPQPYVAATQIKVFKQQKAADKFAEKMNQLSNGVELEWSVRGITFRD